MSFTIGLQGSQAAAMLTGINAHCLTFDGFCGDVIAFYEKVFQIKAAQIIIVKETK